MASSSHKGAEKCNLTQGPEVKSNLGKGPMITTYLSASITAKFIAVKVVSQSAPDSFCILNFLMQLVKFD